MSKRRPRILVVSSCTGLKARSGRAPAEDLYLGQHHVRLMEGVRTARESGHFEIDLRIVSAGYGLVRATDELAPYDFTFQGMGAQMRRDRSDRLSLPRDIRKTLGQPYDLGIVLLGHDYLSACQIDEMLTLGGPTLAFCSPGSALSLPSISGLVPLAIGAKETRRFACGLIGLKGELGRRLLLFLSEHPGQLSAALQPDLLSRLDDYGPRQPRRVAAEPLFG